MRQSIWVAVLRKLAVPAAVLGGAAAVASLPAAAADPAPLGSYSGRCVTGEDEGLWFDAFSIEIPASREGLLARFETQSGPSSAVFEPPVSDAIHVGGADVGWTFVPNAFAAGQRLRGTVYCDDKSKDVVYTVRIFGVPTVPTSFSGALTYSSYGPNLVAFDVATPGHYVAILTLTQGELTIFDGSQRETFSASGQLDLGVIDAGRYALELEAGEQQARWRLSVRTAGSGGTTTGTTTGTAGGTAGGGTTTGTTGTTGSAGGTGTSGTTSGSGSGAGSGTAGGTGSVTTGGVATTGSATTGTAGTTGGIGAVGVLSLSQARADRRYVRPGGSVRFGYVLGAAARVEARIVSARGKLVRELVRGVESAAGSHTLRWNGRTPGGRAVRDGVYRLLVVARDAAGGEARTSASVRVDAVKPSVRLLSSPRLARRGPVVVDVRDAASGIAQAVLTVDGRALGSLAGRNGRIAGVAPGGWRPGRHRVVVTASDRAGNVTTFVAAFTAAA